MRYKFSLKPLDHQVVEFNHHLSRFHTATFSETGAGKTLGMLASVEARIQWGLAKNALYVCPAYLMVKIAQEVEKCTNLTYTIIHDGRRQKRLKLLESDTQIHIMNVEAVYRYEEYLRETKKRGKYDIIVVDEAHHIKDHNGRNSAALQRLGMLAKFRIAATGTPLTRSPEDVYGIMEFVDPALFGMNLKQFRDTFCHREDVEIGWIGNGIQKTKMTLGFKEGTEPAFRRRYQHAVVRHLKKDCLQLPPKFIEVRRVPLAEPIRKAYKEIYDNHLIQMPDGTIVEMANRGVQAGRLAQVCSGFLQYPDRKDPRKKLIHYFGESKKLDAIRDILEARTDKKTVVWCVYRETIRLLAKEFKDWNPVIQIGGAKNESAREKFQNDPNVHLIINQVQINAGYELTAADCVIYYELPHGYGHWVQSQDRTHRKGSEVHRQILYYLIVTQGTVEPSIRVGLKRKEGLADLVVSEDPDALLLGKMEDDDDDMQLADAA